MKKNMIAFLIVVALLVCLIPTAFAVEAPALTVTPSAETVAPGGTFTVTVALTNNPGNVSGVVTLTATAGLELTAVTPVVADAADFQINLANGKVGYSIIEEVTATEPVLFTATYKVPEDAAEDTQYTVTAAGAEFYTAYPDGNTFAVTSGSGSVTVKTPSGVTVTTPGYEDIDYTVDGQVVTVTHEVACKVGYWDAEEGKYVAIPAVKSGDSYTFTAPAGVTEVIVVVKGDLDGNGDAAVADKLTIARSLLPTAHAAHTDLTALQIFAADFDNTGAVEVADKLTMARSLLPNSHAAHADLAW